MSPTLTLREAAAGLVRRRGGWPFGAAEITDAIVEHLAASGKVFRDGDHLHPTTSE